MLSEQIHNFRTIEEFQESIKEELNTVNQQIESYSKIIGEKIRQEEKENNQDFSELKEKLESNDNSKSKQKSKKTKKSSKNKNEDWISYDEINLFNGIGTKGEIELYFKFLEQKKQQARKLEVTKTTVEKLISSGIKKDLGCLGLKKDDGTYDITFVNSPKKKKFAYKSIITIGCEA